MNIQFGASLLTWTLPAWTAERGKYAIEQSARAGFDLLEILLPADMQIDTATVKQQLQDHKLGVVCSLNLPSFAHIPFYPQVAGELIKKAVEKTVELGAELLGGVLHGGIGVFSGKPLTRLEKQTVCDVLGEAARYAQSLGVHIAIEPINRYESYVCTCADDVLQIIETVNLPNIGLHLDTFHMNIEEAGFIKPVLAAGSHLKHVHITESDRGMPGEGNVHWDDFFQALTSIHYKGALVLENFSSSVPGMAECVSLWRPSRYDAAELAAGSLRFIQEKWAEHSK
ncbi:sugar phosphate isomerase/epimerase [Spirosoma humi]